MEKALKEIVEKLSEAARDFGPAPIWYFKSEYPFLANIPVPLQRKISKSGFSFSHLPYDDQLPIWTYVWNNATHFEILSQALLFMERRQAQLDKNDWKILKTWSDRIDNWAHSDSLSSYYARLLENQPKLVYPTLRRWNVSKNPWLRRLSLTSLFYYARSRKKQPQFADVLPLIKARIEDPHFYVQKGVGWAIREMYNVYPERTLRFLEEQAQALSALAWPAATEKLKKADKRRLSEIRKRRK